MSYGNYGFRLCRGDRRYCDGICIVCPLKRLETSDCTTPTSQTCSTTTETEVTPYNGETETTC